MIHARLLSTAVPRVSYGFIGLGAMGLGMAKNLAAKIAPTDSLLVYDINTEAAKSVTGPSVSVASSISDIARSADTIITMLPEGKHVKQVYAEVAEALGADHPSKLYIDSSTVDVECSLGVSEMLRSKNLGKFVDAPVSGGVVGAANGTLTFMVGTDKLGAIEPTLAMMGKKAFACGGPGGGLAAKLANNYILAVTNVATAEGFALASKLGLDMKLFSEVVNTSSGRSWSTEVNNPVPGVSETTPSSRDYDNGFAINLMKKDLLLALGAADLAKLKLLLGDNAAQVYEIMAAEGLGRKDMSVIYKWLNEVN